MRRLTTPVIEFIDRSVIRRRLGVLFLLSVCLMGDLVVEGASPKWVAIYCHSDPAKTNGVTNLQRFLTTENGFRAEVVTPDEIAAGRLKAFDLLIVPGGSGSKQAQMLGEQGRQEIREFVKGGGGYLGICAGSYLATTDYTWSLHLLNAKVVDRAHWARGTGTVTLEIPTEKMTVLQQQQPVIDVYYGQGPLLAPDNKPDMPAFETWATYKTEIAKKGAQPGVMPGTVAIASAPYGEGRVVCFSPHPESQSATEHLICGGIAWILNEEPVAADGQPDQVVEQNFVP